MNTEIHLEIVRLERLLKTVESEGEKVRIEQQIVRMMNMDGIPTKEQAEDKSSGKYGGIFGYEGDASFPR